VSDTIDIVATPDAVLLLRLAEVIVPLAADANEQVAYLGRHGVGVEELKLHFEWTRRWTPRLRQQGVLPARCGRLLDDLVTAFEVIGPSPAAWSHEALRASPDWEALRGVARDLLDELAALAVAAPNICDELVRRTRRAAGASS
jgi:hypothetical protein